MIVYIQVYDCYNLEIIINVLKNLEIYSQDKVCLSKFLKMKWESVEKSNVSGHWAFASHGMSCFRKGKQHCSLQKNWEMFSLPLLETTYSFFFSWWSCSAQQKLWSLTTKEKCWSMSVWVASEKISSARKTASICSQITQIVQI